MSDEARPRYTFLEWRLMMAVLIMARYFPDRLNMKFENFLAEYLCVVDLALSECNPEEMGTQAWYDEGEGKILARANRYWLQVFQERAKRMKGEKL